MGHVTPQLEEDPLVWTWRVLFDLLHVGLAPDSSYASTERGFVVHTITCRRVLESATLIRHGFVTRLGSHGQ